MKTRLIGVMVILMLVASASAFAGNGFWVGPVAQYNNYMTLDEFMDEETSLDFSADDFKLGAEARLAMGLLQVGATAVYHPDLYILGDSIELNADLGLYLDLGIVGLGVGAGPRYLLPIEYDEEFDLGSNIKLNADLILGTTLFSAYFMGYVDDLGEWLEDDSQTVGDLEGTIGLSVLFQL